MHAQALGDLRNAKAGCPILAFRGFGYHALHQTKTSGPNTEEAVLYDRVAVGALQEACAGLGPGDRVYTRGVRFFGEDLRWLGSMVGFRHQRFTPYTLRRGGATWHFHRHGSLALTALTGRWQQERTAKIYIDGAAAEWASWQVDEVNAERLQRGSALVKRKFG